jgi:D-glycero-D-manno-heptose 1,7-bisphosphate phosphatase
MHLKKPGGLGNCLNGLEIRTYAAGARPSRGVAGRPACQEMMPGGDLGEVLATSGGMKHAVFLERDGIFNQVRVERNHPVTPLSLEAFQVRLEVLPLVRRLKEAGLLVLVTTNQPGLTRGYQSRRELDRMHALLRANFPIDDILVCPHDDIDQCPCRKPKPGLFIEAGYNYLLDFDRSFVLSDRWQDAEAGRASGCTSVLIQSPWIGHVHRDFLVTDLEAGVDKICALHANPQLVPMLA